MQISPITPGSSTSAGPGSTARPEARPRVADRPVVRRAKEPTPPPGMIGSNQLVEFGHHGGTGAQTVKFIDKRTGEVLNQFPAEQVLDAVTNLMRMIQEEA